MIAAMRLRKHSVIPGFGLTLGFTILYLSLIVLIPISGLLFKTATLSWEAFWSTVTTPRVLAAYRDLPHSQWRYVLPVTAQRLTGAELILDQAGIRLVNPQPAKAGD